MKFGISAVCAGLDAALPGGFLGGGPDGFLGPYRFHVAVWLGLFCILCGILIHLALEVRRRRGVEEALREEVAKRKEAEAAAQDAAAFSRLLFEEAGDNIVLLRPRPDGPPIVVDMNRKAVRLHGFDTKAEIVGREVTELDTPESAAPAAERMQRVQALGELRFEVRHLIKGGGTVPLEVHARLIDVKGVPHVLAVERDITERLDWETRLRQAQKMEAIGTLAGGIAHDFNNILTPIMAHAELAILHLPDESAARKDIAALLSAAERAAALVQQILAISRQEEVGVPTPVNLGALVKETAKFLRASIPATIELRVEVDPSSGSVLAEPTRLHQVLLNLCTNASYAMAETGGVLSVTLVREGPAQGPGLLRLTVSDTGPGIPEEVRGRIFEPYFTTKPVGKGSGLGLAVVHGIVLALGGNIRVVSAPGEGARFEVLLPETEGAAPLGASPRAERFQGAGRRVLAVDDEPGVRAVLGRLLSFLGFAPTVVGSGGEALAAFREDPRGFDAVLTDCTMPGMTGMVLAAELRSLRADLPILVGTGFTEGVDERAVAAAGLQGLVKKPYSARSLGEALGRAFQSSKPAGEDAPG